MKRNLWNCWRIIGMIVALMALCPSNVLAQDPKPEQGRPEAKEAERNDRKANGPAEPAEGVRRGGKEFRAQVDRPERDPLAKGKAKDERGIELKRELLKAREAMRQLQEQGNDAEAAEVERRVQNLEAELARRQWDRGDEADWRGPRPPETADLERRLRHLKVAVDNLHAAGMHEPADMLAQEGERMKRELVEQERAGLRGPMPAGPEIERLHAELQELRRTVEELRDRVEALSKERR